MPSDITQPYFGVHYKNVFSLSYIIVQPRNLPVKVSIVNITNLKELSALWAVMFD